MGHTGGVGRLLLGHSLGGCSGGETADRYEDVPACGGCQPVTGASLTARSDLVAVADVGVDLAGDVALEASEDLSFAFALRGTAFHVGPGAVI